MIAPRIRSSGVPWSAFPKLWEPKGNGLVCWKDPQSSPSQIANHKLKVAAVMHGHNPQAGGRQCPSGFSTHNMWRVWLWGQGGQPGCFTEPVQLFTPHNILASHGFEKSHHSLPSRPFLYAFKQRSFASGQGLGFHFQIAFCVNVRGLKRHMT